MTSALRGLACRVRSRRQQHSLAASAGQRDVWEQIWDEAATQFKTQSWKSGDLQDFGSEWPPAPSCSGATAGSSGQGWWARLWTWGKQQWGEQQWGEQQWGKQQWGKQQWGGRGG